MDRFTSSLGVSARAALSAAFLSAFAVVSSAQDPGTWVSPVGNGAWETEEWVRDGITGTPGPDDDAWIGGRESEGGWATSEIRAWYPLVRNGRLTIANGGYFETQNELFLGRSIGNTPSTGRLFVEEGGVVYTPDLFVGNATFSGTEIRSVGEISLSSGFLTAGEATIGNGGVGRLDIANGGRLNANRLIIGNSLEIAPDRPLVAGTGEVTASGFESILQAQEIVVGANGASGVLTLSDFARVSGWNIVLGSDGGSGILNIGDFSTGYSPVLLDVESVHGNGGEAVINFRQENDGMEAAFYQTLTGNLQVNVESGVVQLESLLSNRTGGTLVSGGELRVSSEKDLGTGRVHVTGPGSRISYEGHNSPDGLTVGNSGIEELLIEKHGSFKTWETVYVGDDAGTVDPTQRVITLDDFGVLEANRVVLGRGNTGVLNLYNESTLAVESELILGQNGGIGVLNIGGEGEGLAPGELAFNGFSRTIRSDGGQGIINFDAEGYVNRDWDALSYPNAYTFDASILGDVEINVLSGEIRLRSSGAYMGPRTGNTTISDGSLTIYTAEDLGTGDVSITGPSSRLILEAGDDVLRIGEGGVGELTIERGGRLRITSSLQSQVTGTVEVGQIPSEEDPSDARITISGPGSELASQSIVIGNGSKGIVNLQDQGALVTSAPITLGEYGGTGVLNIGGENAATEAGSIRFENLQSWDRVIRSGSNSKGIINFNHTDQADGYFFDHEINGDVQINVLSGITNLRSGGVRTGETSITGGTLNTSAVSLGTGAVHISGANSKLVVSDGSTGSFRVGDDGVESISLSNGAQLAGSNLMISGEVAATDSNTSIEMINSVDLSDGALLLNHHATTRANQVNLGFGFGSILRPGDTMRTTGIVTIEDQAILEASTLRVGSGGNGVLAIKDGGQVLSDSAVIGAIYAPQEFLAQNVGGHGDVVVSGENSLLRARLTLMIGSKSGELAGTGTLTISDGARVEVGQQFGRVELGGQTSGSIPRPFDQQSIGILNIGGRNGAAPTKAGVIKATEIVGANPNQWPSIYNSKGIINFNHTDDDYLFSPTILGVVTVNVYSGHTIFNERSINNYTGGTEIFGGSLTVRYSTSLGTGPTIVHAGGTLLHAGNELRSTIFLDGGQYRNALDYYSSLDHLSLSSLRDEQPHTKAAILDGFLDSPFIEEPWVQPEVVTSFSDLPSSLDVIGDHLRISDVFSLSGTGESTFVLQMSVADLAEGAWLGWINDENQWVNAIYGNTNNNPLYTGAPILSSFEDFRASFEWFDLYDVVGAWGRTENGEVWAVLNHNSQFAVMIPEPSTYVLVILGLVAACFAVQGRRARNR